MSGFDKTWLALREPADIAARDETLLAAVAKQAPAVILDIGCGTGSTFRALAPKLSQPARWRLFDYDRNLLNEAERLHGGEVELFQGDLNEIAALPLDGIDLVTASALFDLCSEAFIGRLVARLAENGIGLYAALNYDGVMEWSKPHPLDDAVVANFNAHQLSDKGFGPSLGPQAWTILAQQLEGYGYRVQLAESPWLMTGAEADLQRLFLEGVVRAVFERGELDEAELRDWVDFRRRMVEKDGSLCRVGHRDVLAFR